jgi:tetraacyldisaccharide 4'-kinase
LIDATERDRIWQRVGRIAPEATRLELAHRPRNLVAADGGEMPLADLAGLPVAAFCGIGNPAGFRRTLLACGCRLSELRELPDHFPYGRTDVEALAAWIDSLGDCQAVICTQKDLVKLRVSRLGRLPLWALAIELEILQGRDDFERLLEPLACQAAAGNGLPA